MSPQQKSQTLQTSMQHLRDIMTTLEKTKIILDVRGKDEFAEGHLRGAINIPHDEIARRANELEQYEQIYIHCRSGKRAQIAVAELEKLGFTKLHCVSNGGMLDWVAAGYEIVTT